jgi:hypothetical protein
MTNKEVALMLIECANGDPSCSTEATTQMLRRGRRADEVVDR